MRTNEQFLKKMRKIEWSLGKDKERLINFCENKVMIG